MNNQEKYDAAFIETLGVSEDQLQDLEYRAVSMWDSVGHMQLMAALEDQFDIFLETEDIIDFSSYERGMKILEKYGVEF